MKFCIADILLLTFYVAMGLGNYRLGGWVSSITHLDLIGTWIDILCILLPGLLVPSLSIALGFVTILRREDPDGRGNTPIVAGLLIWLIGGIAVQVLGLYGHTQGG